MNSLLFSFGSFKLEWHTVALSFLLAFLLSTPIAWVYQRTFKGMSWTRGMVHSMVLGSLISCLLMIAIGDNVARGIGIVGSLALIRFRTNLRDPRDLIFLFAALGVGVASGVQSYFAALTGCLVFCSVALALNLSTFGQRNLFDGLVRFQAPAGPQTSQAVATVMGRVPRTFALVTMRAVAQGEAMEFAYQVAFRNKDGADHLLEALRGIEGLRGLTFMNQHTTVEM